MSGVWRQIVLSLRLHFRNRMALLYNYLFPTMFLLAFWALYRYERVPIQAHLGELLTVTVLGGACFGLPTTMVSERERGVWRRYRLMPVSSAALVTSTLLARYVMLLAAALLQLGLAMGLGLPFPDRPLELWVTFTCGAVAFMGLGLVIAMLANTVPAVQALGQCLFLPMLIIGGVAVPLARLPDWAQTVSSFLPGRYSVQAIQASVTGPGFGAALFSVAALLTIGAAGCFAAARLFRWDAHERIALGGSTGWVAVALVPWFAIGLLSESRRTSARSSTRSAVVESATRPQPPPVSLEATPTAAERALGAEPAPAAASSLSSPVAPAVREPLAPEGPTAPEPIPAPSPGSSAAEPAASAPPDPTSTAPPPWQSVTQNQIEMDLVFDRLPPDDAVVTPLARIGERPDPAVVDQLALIRRELDTWTPGLVSDPEQRARNLLYLPGVIDLLQLPLEPYVPRIIFERLERDIPRADLVRILYWIAVHWASGEHAAIDELGVFGIEGRPDDVDQIRNRASIYAVKLLGRLTGQIPD